MENEWESRGESIKKIYKGLKDIHELLIKANRINGSLERYTAVKNEIEQHGWAAICAKYHPDVNLDDPAAFELFEFYRYVYSRIENKH